MKQFLLSLILLLMVSLSSANAQEKRISGKVTSSEDGSALPGVTVLVQGTSIANQTDVNGMFSILVPSGRNVLVFKLIGYEDRSATIGQSTTLNIVLESTSHLIDEVIVVAYGTVNKSTHVGSTAQITSESISKRPISNALNAVVGAAPGVQTTMSNGAPGSAPSIRVRGFGSISASNSALYVIDGVPYDAGTANIAPEDVESISILKDASTTALYGSRGANGVIMITTKKGKAGQSNFNVNASYGTIERGLPEYERVNAFEYYPLMWEVSRNSMHFGAEKIPLNVANSIASGLTTTYNGKNYSGVADLLVYNPFNVAKNQIVDVNGNINPGASLLYGEDLDWAKQIAQGGKQRQNYLMSYDGGVGKTDYFSSLSYTEEDGYLLNSNLKRFTGRVNLNTQATDWLRTGLNLSGTYSKSDVDGSGDGGSTFINPFYISRFMGPIYPVHLHDPVTGAYVLDENGNQIFDKGDRRPNSSGRHTIWENLLNKRYQIRGVLSARTYATVNIAPGLTATTNISFDLQDVHNREFDNQILGDGAPAGRASHYLYRTTSYTFNQILNYDIKFGKHTIGALAGHENYAYKYNYLYGGRSGLIVEGVTELPNFATVLGVSSYENNRTIESYFSRVNYDFDQKYVLSASLRRDGNSRFHPDFRWANFWSVGGAYNIHKEEFFNVDWVNMLKVRASYGVVGNDGDLGNYPYQALYTLGRNNNAEPGFVQASLPNDSLTWESSHSFDVGVDFSLLKNRLSGTVEYFNRETTGLIFNVPIALSNGGTYSGGGFEIDQNIGNLYNRGLEIQLNGQIVKTDNFQYTATLNWTKFKNQITKMPDNQNLIQSGTKAYSVGHSIYDFYLREFYGVNPDNGDALYKTNAMTSNSRIIGMDTVTNVIAEANYRYTGHSSIPKYYGSMTNNFTYKSLTLGVQFTYQVGGKVYDSSYGGLMHGGTYGTAMHVDAKKRWQNPGDVTDVPRFDAGNISNFAGGSTRWLTSASYFQLNNVSLNYGLPKSLTSSIGARDVNVYVTGDNLALFSARKGMNATGSFNGTVANTYNFNRVISIGARVRF